MAVQGETWDRVAHRVYGTGAEVLMGLLLEANPEYREITLFGGGEVLIVPDEPETTSTGEVPPWMD